MLSVTHDHTHPNTPTHQAVEKVKMHMCHKCCKQSLKQNEKQKLKSKQFILDNKDNFNKQEPLLCVYAYAYACMCVCICYKRCSKRTGLQCACSDR